MPTVLSLPLHTAVITHLRRHATAAADEALRLMEAAQREPPVLTAGATAAAPAFTSALYSPLYTVFRTLLPPPLFRLCSRLLLALQGLLLLPRSGAGWPQFGLLQEAQARLLSVYEKVASLIKEAENYESSHSGVFSTASPTLSSFILRLLRSAALFLLWVLNPYLFFRRIYRMLVGVIVLYLLHRLLLHASRAVRFIQQWVAAERGLWNGDQLATRTRDLENAMSNASSYASWKQAAAALDELIQDRVDWKFSAPSSVYQYKLIEKNVEVLRRLIENHLQAAGRQSSATLAPPALPTNATQASSNPASLSQLQAPIFASSSPSSSSSPLPSASPSPPHSDPAPLLTFLRSRLTRNAGNITDERLYSVSNGTKALIESYYFESCRALDTVLDSPSLPAASKVAFFRELKHAFGRTALILKGGAIQFGVVKALLEMESLPHIVCGSGVGSVFAALICSSSDDELARVSDDSEFAQLLHIPSLHGSVARKLQLLISGSSAIELGSLVSWLRGKIGDITFLEAYQRYGRVCNILVSPVSVQKTRKRAGRQVTVSTETDDETSPATEPIYLNYLSAPDVLIWSAACASASVPQLYAPVEILAKQPGGDNSQPTVSASAAASSSSSSPSSSTIYPFASETEGTLFQSFMLDDSATRLALDRLRTLFNCNSFIVSELRVSTLLFSPSSPYAAAFDPLKNFVLYLAREIASRCFNLMQLFGVSWQSSFSNYRLARFLAFLRSLSPKAEPGVVLLVPPLSLRDLLDPSPSRLMECIDAARRYTWTKGAWIRAHCVVELALNRCFRRARDGEMGSGLPPPLHGVAHSNSLTTPTQSPIANSLAVPAYSFPSHSPITATPVASPLLTHSPSSTPNPVSQPAERYWKKQLNARALEPVRPQVSPAAQAAELQQRAEVIQRHLSLQKFHQQQHLSQTAEGASVQIPSSNASSAFSKGATADASETVITLTRVPEMGNLVDQGSNPRLGPPPHVRHHTENIVFANAAFANPAPSSSPQLRPASSLSIPLPPLSIALAPLAKQPRQVVQPLMLDHHLSLSSSPRSVSGITSRNAKPNAGNAASPVDKPLQSN